MTWNTGSPMARIRMVCPLSTPVAWLGAAAARTPGTVLPMATAITARLSKKFFLFRVNTDWGIATAAVAAGSRQLEVYSFICSGGGDLQNLCERPVFKTLA